MKIARRLAVLVLMPTLAAASARSVAPGSVRSETVQAFIARVYRPYMRTAVPTGNETAWPDRGLLSRDFLRLVKLDSRLAGGEEGYIDADPICACQDWGHFSYRITSIRSIDARRFVTIRLQNWGQVQNITLVLIRDGHGSFVIDDMVHDGDQTSFKDWLSKLLLSRPER